MEKYKLLIFTLLTLCFASCVQKSSKKTVIVKLNVVGLKDIKSVGIRGSQKPLSWENDLELKPIIKDSLYEASFSLITGYKFTEGKFTVNGNFELNDKDNRRIIFSENDTTIYEAKFDVAKN
jgi:hypothetical protein